MMGLQRRMLIISGGHAFDRPSFDEMLTAVLKDRLGVKWDHVEHPAARAYLNPAAAQPYDVIIFYDNDARDHSAERWKEEHEELPTPEFCAGFEALLDAGKPLLFLHHGMFSWPGWHRYSEIVGATVRTRPKLVAGRQTHAGGYIASTTHRLYPVAEHPILTGLEGGFDIEDEVIFGDIFEDLIEPLMRSSLTFTTPNFSWIESALKGQPSSNAGWSRPDGSNAYVWTRRERNSAIVCILAGNAPSAYDNPGFRTLFGNSVKWLAETQQQS